MAIRKLEFYEGAALYRLIRSFGEVRLRVDGGGIIINEIVCVYLKYSTRTRSPWSFTFSGRERSELATSASKMSVVIGLVCGSDGVAALDYDGFLSAVGEGESQVSLSCARGYDKHYAVSGPAGSLTRKLPPSAWDRLLLVRSGHETL